MVLNLLRVEEVNPEIMLESSFYQYQNYAAIPDMVKSEYGYICLELDQLKYFRLITKCLLREQWLKGVGCPLLVTSSSGVVSNAGLVGVNNQLNSM